MNEADLRWLAGQARLALPQLVLDEADRMRVQQRLDAALDRPPGHAGAALVAALTSHPAVHTWFRERVEERTEAGGLVLASPDAASGEPLRSLAVEVPDRAPPGCRLTVLAQIVQRAPAGWRSAALRAFDVPPAGATVTVTVSAPDLEPVGDLEQDVHVPAEGDSDPVRFGFITRRNGLHTVMVRAFRGGTFLGEVLAQLSVDSGATVSAGPPRVAYLDNVAAEPGEVTLEVSRAGDRYSFRLIGEGAHPVEQTQRLGGDPQQVVEMLVGELCRLAAGTSRHTTPAARTRRLRNLGVSLWADAVPEAVRGQFWQLRDRIKAFTVASDRDVVPWELLHPVDGGNDAGFLVGQFPVLRRVPGQGRAGRLTLRNAAYVVPPNPPRNAMDEVRLVRETLGGGVRDLGLVQGLGEFDELLDYPPGLLHFACHNEFTEQGGALIRMAEGPLTPTDLAMAVQQRSLRDQAPLVFLNACRTAGEIPGLIGTMGWARQFMAAGAGAFLGTLWAVRSGTAQRFARAFYELLVTAGLPLGQAALQARRAVAAEDGDPTWLAYSVYGHAATAVAPGDRHPAPTDRLTG
jgi:hypothetical protein